MKLAAGLVLASLGLLAGAANGQPAGMTVTGGGLARACSEATTDGESAFRFEKICTNALNFERLTPEGRAATLVNRGIIRLRHKSYDQAIADFNLALRYRPEFAEAYANRGAADIGAHRFAESLSDINRALALGVQRPEKAFYNRGLAHEGLDDLGSAHRDYERALEFAPNWTLVKEQIAHIARGQSDPRPQDLSPQS